MLRPCSSPRSCFLRLCRYSDMPNFLMSHLPGPKVPALLRLPVVLLFWLVLAVPSPAAEVDEDKLLLLDVVLERYILASSVTAYEVGNNTVVSLAEFVAALEFPIVVDPGAGTASGSFINPKRNFKLDIKAGQVEVDGIRQTIASDDALVHQGAIFVSVDALARWFPVDLHFLPTTLSIQVVPRERLPLQDRQTRREEARGATGVTPAVLPLIDSPYKLLGTPVADVGLSYIINRPASGGSPNTGVTYSVQMAGDVARMDGHLFFNGDKDNGLSDTRASLSRDRLGMPLGLRYVEIGDIVPAIVPGLSYSGVERGILVQGGGSVTGRDDLISSDTINISGDALPGWDVELFQNGNRVGFQTIGPEGRYNFTNLDPVAGENKFELVSYGPAGERRSETVIRNSGLGPDQPGSMRYQLSLSQKGQHLFQGTDTSSLNESNLGSTRVAAGMDVRVLPSLALRGSWNNLMQDGRRLNYATLGMVGEWHEIALTADAIRDPLGGNTWNGSIKLPAKMNLWGFDTRLSHTQYAQTLQSNNTLQLTSRTGVSLSGPIGPASTLFSLYHNREPGRTSNSLSAGFTARSGKISFGNNLNYYLFGRNSSGTQDPSQMTGNAFFSTAVQPLSLRGGMSYTLKPTAVAREYYLDSNLSVAKDMTMNFGINYTPLTGITRYTSGLNWQLPQVTLSPRVSYDSDGAYGGFIYAAFSLAPRPDRAGVLISGNSLVTSGAVAARVYADNDADGSFTTGDEPLSGVLVRAPQAFRTGVTDQHGVAYLTGITTTRATDVEISEGSLPRVQMVSKSPGNSVRPRPGSIEVVNFPVASVGEIDGYVYSLQQGRQVPLAGAVAELRGPDGQVVASRTTTSDGFFVFEEIPLASYVLNLAGELREKSSQPKVVLTREQALQQNIDIVVAEKSADPETRQPIPPAPVTMTQPAPTTPAPASSVPGSAEQTTQPVIPAAPETALVKPQDGRVAQLGAFANVQAAQAYRRKLMGLDLLQAARIEVVSVDLGNYGQFHRVFAIPTDISADQLCGQLKSRGTPCFTITP